MNLRRYYRTLLVAGSVALAVGVFLFTQKMITRLSHEVTTTSRVLARFLAQASFPAARHPELEKVPYMVVVGPREAEAGTVAPRRKHVGTLEPMTRQAFLERVLRETRERST